MKPHHETSADAERRRYKESVYNTAVCVGAAIIFGRLHAAAASTRRRRQRRFRRRHLPARALPPAPPIP